MPGKLPTFALLSFAALSLSCGATPPLAGAAPQAKSAPPRDARFTILQINDAYRIEGLEGGTLGGFARVRTLRKQLEAEGRPVLLLHAGDFLFPSVMSKFLRGEPMVKMLNLLDGDPAARDPRLVVVFGNHEFDDKDPGLLLGRIAESDFSWVSSNTRYRSTKDAAGERFSHRLSNMHDSLVVDLDGTKVGVVGVTTDVQARDYVAYEYGDQKAREDAIRGALGRLKEGGAQVRVALTHQDFDEDVRLAQTFPEVDLIVGGHEHFFIERQVGRTWITKADADAASAVVHDVSVRDGVVTTTHRKVDLDAKIAPDPATEKAISAWVSELSKAAKAQTHKDLLAEVGKTQNKLEGVEPAVRGRETALGDFLADVIRDRMKTDVAFLNGGAIRINDNIPPGPVTNYHMEGIFYFADDLVAFELTGAEILDLLRNAVAKVHAGSGQFLQVSSIQFQYHVGGSKEQPSYRIDAADVRVRPRGATAFVPLDVGKRYKAASITYLWESGCLDGFKVFSQACKGASPKRIDAGDPVGFRAATEETIAALPQLRITTAVEGRIVRVEK